MKDWDWLSSERYSWGFGVRVVVKAAALFILMNLLWVVLNPLPMFAHASVYGWLVPYRERLPYGENTDANNLSTDSLEAMFATHLLNRPKAADEYRVIVLGDSATWGILLDNPQTTTGNLNALGLLTSDNKRMMFYNVAHPIMSLTKDLLLLDIAKGYAPDMVVWINSLESFNQAEQLDPPLVKNNAEQVRALIRTYGLASNTDDARLTTPALFDQTLVGQRRLLADWLRLQFYGLAWSATRVDQVYGTFTPRSNDYDADTTWKGIAPTDDLPPQLAFDTIRAAHTLLDVPIVLVNEPIYIGDGANSDLRYNVWYPRAIYDDFRALYTQQAQANDWVLLDVWNAIQSREFTDSPVHLTPTGSREFAEFIAWTIQSIANNAIANNTINTNNGAMP